MKIQSLTLFQYLKDQGVLGGPEEAIVQAKAEYRRQYKHDWYQQRKKNAKTIQIQFTNVEHDGIVLRAKLFGLNPTEYGRQAILSQQQNTDLIPNKDALLKVLQKVAMAGFESLRTGNRDLMELLDQAESLLTTYVRQQ